MPVIDCHVHIFPDQGGACGYDTIAEHVRYQSSTIGRFRKQPIHGDDGTPVPIPDDKLVVNNIDPGSLRSVGFGRFEWTNESRRRSVQFLPPSLTDNSYAAEALIAEMDFAGVDCAILQNDRFYGNLGRYFSEAIKRIPGRLIGLAQIDELAADQPAELRSLEYQVSKLGMKGLYYSSAVFGSGSLGYDDPRYAEFWAWLSDKKIPVFFLMLTPIDMNEHLIRINTFSNFCNRHQSIRFVLVHGLPIERYQLDGDHVLWPRELHELSRLPNLAYEVTHPVNIGNKEDYPYDNVGVKLINDLVNLVGSDKVLWGSDMPASNIYCTYRQARSYLDKGLMDLGNDDLAAITGGNAARIFGLESPAASIRRPAASDRTS